MPAKSQPSLPPWATAARHHLREVDPAMKRIIDDVGPVRIARRRERFPALVRAIIFQQLAGRAAQTILDRFIVAVGAADFPTPEQVLAATDETLRGAGLSRGKMSYVRDLAIHVRDGTLNFHRFPRMTDDDIIADLTRVRGIGRWTAEMFLMFNLGRPDVLPVDDLGVRNAVTKAYGLAEPISAKALREMGERWRPYRTAASWYLWQSMRIIAPDGAKPKEAKPENAKAAAAAKPRVGGAKARAKSRRSKVVTT
jgi:DNA-3-methyladenine glycosylase II